MTSIKISLSMGPLPLKVGGLIFFPAISLAVSGKSIIFAPRKRREEVKTSTFVHVLSTPAKTYVSNPLKIKEKEKHGVDWI